MIEENTALTNLSRALVRARPDLPVHLRPLASLLAEQLKNYEGNPETMRPMIKRTIERLTINAEDSNTHG